MEPVALGAAPFAPMVSEPVLAEGKRLWAERANPAAAAEHADVEGAEAALRENYNDVINGIKSDAGLADDLRARLTK